MIPCPPSFDFNPILYSIPVGQLFGSDFALPIRWYALAYIAGLLLGWRYMAALARRPAPWAPRGAKPGGTPFTVDDVDDLLLWATVGVIAGGRLGYVLFYQIDAIWTDPVWIVTGIVEGGMSFHGGLIGVGLALYFTARSRKVPLLRLSDAVAMVAPIGLFFGRLANFANGELWGRPTDLPWGMRFAADQLCQLRHPSQLYEAALEGLAIFLIVNIAAWKFRSLTRPGLNTGLFLLSYGLFRAILETVREPDAHMPEALQGLVTMGMLLSIPMIIAGAWLVWRAMKATPVAIPAPKAA